MLIVVQASCMGAMCWLRGQDWQGQVSIDRSLRCRVHTVALHIAMVLRMALEIVYRSFRRVTT